MVPQRAYTLVALVIAIGIGIGLLWPAVDAPGAEAADRVTWRCLAPLAQRYYIQVHNSSTSTVVARFSFFASNGTKPSGAPLEIELGSRQTSGIDTNGPEPNGLNAFAEVRGPSSIVVAGYVSSSDAQIACYKKAG